MQIIKWPELELTLSQLAFGCAPIMGRVSKREALNAMAMAFEHEVTHFDLARAYGFGEAEGVVGGFIADKRDKVTIATKFGILPTQMSQAARRLKPLVRLARRWVPALAGVVKKASGAHLSRGYYGLKDAQHSLETSLRELRVEAVDVLFIHECTGSDDLQPELLAFMQKLKTQGKIKAWGMATQAKEIDAASRKLGGRPAVVQFPWEFNNSSPADPPRRILHSPISLMGALRLADGSLPAPLLEWGRGQGMDPAELSRRMPTLALQAAAAAAPQAVILCSMFKPSNILSNTAALRDLQVPLASDFARVASALLLPKPAPRVQNGKS